VSRGGTLGGGLLASLGLCPYLGEFFAGPGRTPVGDDEPLGVLLPLLLATFVFTGVTSVLRIVPVLLVSTVVCVFEAILPAVVLGLIVSKSHSMDSLSEVSETLSTRHQYLAHFDSCDDYTVLSMDTYSVCDESRCNGCASRHFLYRSRTDLNVALFGVAFKNK
jgi:hypothetical protein